MISSNASALHEKAAERVAGFLYTGSFIELSPMSKCGVVTGYGTVDYRLVYIYSQYGAVNRRHADKIANICELAGNMGAPVIALLDSPGAELSDGVELLSAYGGVCKCMTDLHGVVPKIAIVLGNAIGMASMIPMLSDFVIMEEQSARLSLQSPATVNDPAAKSTSLEQMASANQHARTTGIADFLAKNVSEIAAILRMLIRRLPSNNLDAAPLTAQSDDINRDCGSIDNNTPLRDIICSIADCNDFFEVGAEYTGLITGFADFNGSTTALIAASGRIDPQGAQKAARFIGFCDAFNIAIVTLSAVEGYEFSIPCHGDMMKAAANLHYTFASASVPKVGIICGNNFGAAATLIGSKHFGADIVYALNNAQIALLNPSNASKVLNITIDASPELSEELGFIDNVIEPRHTRKMIISALDMLASKRITKTAKKHTYRTKRGI